MQSPDPMTAPNPHLQARPEWLALRREEILEPELPIVDPHHHLVDRANTGRYLLPELLDDINGGPTPTSPVIPGSSPGSGVSGWGPTGEGSGGAHNIVATVYL